MPDAEQGKTERRKFFIGDMKAELAWLQQRCGLDESQLRQIEILMQWSYNTGFHSGPSHGGHMSFNDRAAAETAFWS